MLNKWHGGGARNIPSEFTRNLTSVLPIRLPINITIEDNLYGSINVPNEDPSTGPCNYPYHVPSNDTSYYTINNPYYNPGNDITCIPSIAPYRASIGGLISATTQLLS